MKRAIADRAQEKNNHDSGGVIVRDHLANLTEEEAAALPSVASLERTARKRKYAAQNDAPLPHTRADIVLPTDLKMTPNQDQFLLYDSGDTNRILIFSTRSNMLLLNQHRHWYLDGTFKTVPPLYEQLYSIHASVHGSILPLVYALLPNKREETYHHVLQKIRDDFNVQGPSTATTDFEKANQNALEAVYPGEQMVRIERNI